MRKRRQIVELIGLNNGRTCCSAVKQADKSWLCTLGSYEFGLPDLATAISRRHAESILRDEGNATKILRCPELGAKQKG